MANLLADGAEWLAGQLQDHAEVTITYSRGLSTISAVTATVSVHVYTVMDIEGFTQTVTSRDYILLAASLVLDSETITPRAGDTITETIDGTARTFELMPVGDMKECEPVDAYNEMWTVHTKQVGG